MSTPTAENLFLQRWCTAANSDSAAVAPPGTPEFRLQRTKVFRYWALVWLDCQDLAEHLAAVSEGRRETRELLEAVKQQAAVVEPTE